MSENATNINNPIARGAGPATEKSQRRNSVFSAVALFLLTVLLLAFMLDYSRRVDRTVSDYFENGMKTQAER